jgi:hypothetical protein
MNLYHKIILTTLSVGLIGNHSNFGLTRSEGIIVFERHNGFYFIETKEKNFTKLLASSDTLKIIELASPDEGNNYPAYKEYLSKTIVFKSITYLRTTIDYPGDQIVSQDTADYKAGYIFYYRDNGYNLAKQLEKVVCNGRPTVYKIEPFVSLERFEPAVE